MTAMCRAGMATHRFSHGRRVLITTLKVCVATALATELRLHVVALAPLWRRGSGNVEYADGCSGSVMGGFDHGAKVIETSHAAAYHCGSRR